MKWFMAFALVAPLAAAAEPGVQPGDDELKERDEVRTKIERRMHLMRLVELSDTLGLSDEKALKLSKVMEQFDERRAKVRESTRAARQVVKRASEGDAAAQRQLDQAVEQLIDSRKQMVDIERDTYHALAKELTPQQRAKFVLVVSEFHQRMENLARSARERFHEPEDRPGPPPF